MSDYAKLILTTGKQVDIHYDEDAQNPRDLDYTDCNLTKMVCFHRRYSLGDEHNFDKNDVLSWEELEKLIQKEEDVCVIDPLYLYDHSGITISTSPFSCRWDSGQVGFVYITKEAMRKAYNVKRISKKLKQRAWENLAQEVKTYDQYLTGEVFWFEVLDECSNNIDYCSGFYGTDFLANGMGCHISESLTDDEFKEFEKWVKEGCR